MNIFEFTAATVRLAATGLSGDSTEKGAWERFSDMIRSTLGPPLKSLHGPLDLWLSSLPMSVAIACAIGLFVVAGIWVWTLRREFIFRGAPDQKWWRDLRLWSMIVLLPYITIYLLLGR
jgi:hypothetical protein